jgi:hypothetical protein
MTSSGIWMDYVEYRHHDTAIDRKVSDLFRKYGWTTDYLINSIKVHFAIRLKHQAGEFPLKLYWAYNNELSKSVGLDFSGYLGENVNAENIQVAGTAPRFSETQM